MRDEVQTNFLDIQWEWRECSDFHLWDSELARIGGHPLQSALWGNARKCAEGLEYLCLMGQGGDGSIALARVETRRVPLFGKVAWIPRGPVLSLLNKDRYECPQSLIKYLKVKGFILCGYNPWGEVTDFSGNSKCVDDPMTIWIDLSVGKEQLLKNIDKQWRYGARRALREGVVVEQTKDSNDVAEFYRLCQVISDVKGFSLPATQGLMEGLLALSKQDDPVEVRLFVGRYNEALCAGVFVMRVGKQVHYIWGGVDRKYSKLRAGEAVQWAVMQWAINEGCELYDLEGIDPVNNPGTYQFKKKMGGREVKLNGLSLTPLTLTGALVKAVFRYRYC
jgi:lipid II:glycine glycyltransferase (peptidoglycan interpeptide bridge formation enzyme)